MPAPVPTLLHDRIRAHGSRPAVSDPRRTLSYADLLDAASRVAAGILARGRASKGERVAFLTHPDTTYVATLLGIWSAGAMAVPIRPGLPRPEIAYVLDDADPVALVVDAALAPQVRQLAADRRVPVLVVDDLTSPAASLLQVTADDPALMLYTSGTTGRPKGVVHTHGSLAAQITALVEAWRWQPRDGILLVLPLHHVHGIVNVLCCALWTGAVCEMAGGFEATAVWERFAAGGVTLFMAVPTIYHRLIAAWEAADAPTRERWSRGARDLRLMVSGSAALPVPTLERWREITGHVLLERYGMTEIGMALSNTLEERVPGSVGSPLPGVEVRVVDEAGRDVGEGEPGELLVRGPTLFRGYWRRPEATAASFDAGWFRTGDVVVREEGRYRILGRASVDIIKTGGEKVSALEIEDVLRGHEAVSDCAVVGVDDPDWGERVCAAVVTVDGTAVDVEALRAWCKERLAPSKVPREVRTVAALPRNAMGKVTKPEVARLFG
ncbi:MAG TPA: acyl-CoA synthetase [Egibacteraceae bacterium]